jgi:hypothetical protein
MKKVQNVNVSVSMSVNPYRPGSHKYRLMAWAIEKKEFSKVEFLEAENEIFVAANLLSAMVQEVRGKAWWNEFYAKHKVFTFVS